MIDTSLLLALNLVALVGVFFLSKALSKRSFKKKRDRYIARLVDENARKQTFQGEFDANFVLETVKKNRKDHAKIVEETTESYIQECREKLNEVLDELDEDTKQISIYHDKPKHYLKQYDAAIKMLEKTTSKKVALTVAQYASYIEDEWEWRYDFLASNYKFSKTAEDYFIPIRGK